MDDSFTAYPPHASPESGHQDLTGTTVHQPEYNFEKQATCYINKGADTPAPTLTTISKRQPIGPLTLQQNEFQGMKLRFSGSQSSAHSAMMAEHLGWWPTHPTGDGRPHPGTDTTVRRSRSGERKIRVYDHVTPETRRQVIEVLEKRWALSLAALRPEELTKLVDWFPHVRPALDGLRRVDVDQARLHSIFPG